MQVKVSIVGWFLRFRLGAAILALAGSAIAKDFLLGGSTDDHSLSWLATRVALLDFPAAPLLAIGLVLLGSNLLFTLLLRRGRGESQILTGAILLDLVILTALLSVSGGPANPLSILYLVYLSLAGLLLGERFGWGVMVLSVALYGLLFLGADPHAHHGDHMSYHLQGMWLSFALGGALLVFFQSRLVSALREKERQLSSLTYSQERLASLTTLAAGAAHELGSPLSTIAVAAAELEDTLKGRIGCELLVEDTSLILGEIERCREIIDRMSGRSNTALYPESFTMQEFVAVLRASLHPRVNAALTVEACESSLFLPQRGLLQSIRSLVENGYHASGGEHPVILRIEEQHGVLRWYVMDAGAGMSEEVLRRVGEPFFTTREPGRGMGLGVFLVRLFAERVGGTVSFDSVPGEGTTAVLEIPARLS